MKPSRAACSLPRTSRDLRPLFGLCLLLAACSSTGTSEAERESVRTAIREGEFVDGVRQAEELKSKDPDDAELVDLHRYATVALYLDQGRKETFADRDDEALEWFERAEEIAPDSPVVLEWLGKTRLKLARRELAAGQEAFSREDFDRASGHFQRAIHHVPGYPLAVAGLGQVTIQINYRNGLGEEYYTAGVRALADYRLRSAKRGFSATTKYLPEMDRARRRASEVDRLLAEQRIEIARGFEEEGLYAGALNEFRFALALDDESAEARAGIERLEVEKRAAEILRDAQMKVYRREYEEALALLAEGEELTQAQAEAFAEARESIDGMKLERIYQRALDREYDGDFEGAIEVYAELLAEVDHYKDALARQSTLEGYVEMAALYYERAMAEEDPAAQLEHLRSIEGFWPDYRDIGEIIDRLE